MSEKIPKKLLGGLVGIIIILGGAYFLLGGSPDSGSLETSTSTSNGAGDGVDTSQVVDQLNNLRSLSIDTEFFNSKSFLSLQDFGITINPQEVGRDNPFIPPSYSPTGEVIIPNDSEIDQQPIDISEEEDGVDSSTTTEPDAGTTTQSTTTQATSSNTNSTTSQTGTTTDEGGQ